MPTSSGPDRGSDLPPMVRVRQEFPPAPAVDVAGAVREGLARLATGLPPGARVAVGVGSRGISGLKTVVQAAIERLRESGAQPFVVPAMGSHGGATAEGQTSLLAEYGITETALGVSVRADMAVQRLGRTPEGVEVFCSAEALGADAILLINRIKPHTDFGGVLGSGLFKMLVVGLGKQEGAVMFHRAASRIGYLPALRSAASVLLNEAPLLGGIAIIENQRHETARVEIVPASEFESRELELCAVARELMPRLPLAEVDLLIVDRLGKNISGVGMDPMIIGRSIHGYSLDETHERRDPHVRRLFVRELTRETHGNANGIGLADFTTTRLVESMDRRATTLNSITALSLLGSKIPLHFDTDREVIRRALETLALDDPRQAKVIRIADTLSLEELEASVACVESLERQAAVRLHGPARPMDFDAAGNLKPIGHG